MIYFFIIIVGIIAIIINTIVQSKQREKARQMIAEQQRRKTAEEFIEKFNRFYDQGNIKYIENFIRTSINLNDYPDNFDGVSEQFLYPYEVTRKLFAQFGNIPEEKMQNLEQELQKLQKFLLKKGYDFSQAELLWLIGWQIGEQKEEVFRSKICSGNPSTLKEYISNFIMTYGDNMEQNIDYLCHLLREKDRVKRMRNEKALLPPHIIDITDMSARDKKAKSFIENQIQEFLEEKQMNQFEQKLEDQTPSINMEKIDSFTGTGFESFLGNLFEKMGYNVQQTKSSGDQGADLIISKFGEKVVVQAKRRDGKISNRAIQEVVAAIKHYSVDRAIVITNSKFTRSALELAKSNNIELIDRDRLDNLIKKHF